jgi:glucokinase
MIEPGVPAGVGVDIGGTNICAAVVDESGRLLHRVHHPTPSGSAEVVSEVVSNLLRALAPDHDNRCVGISAAGFIARDGRTVVHGPNVAWRNYPLAQTIEDLAGVSRCHVINDANAAAWAEFRVGAGRWTSDFVLVALGTGVGVGIVANGKLLQGGRGFAGEAGHIQLVRGGPRCGCGRRGCWEQYASGRALGRLGRMAVLDAPERATRLLDLANEDVLTIRGEMLVKAADEGDPLAKEILDDYCVRVAEGIAVLVAILDPNVVTLGGGVPQAGGAVVDIVRRHLGDILRSTAIEQVPRIESAALGNDAALIGAALYV